MTTYNSQIHHVIDYLESLKDETINECMDEFFVSNDMDERMTIVGQVITRLEQILPDGYEDTEWFSNLEDDIKELV